MRLEVTQISANEYVVGEIVRDEIPEKYFYNDNEELLVASNIFDTEKTVYQLINFLFQSNAPAIEIYRDDYTFVLDLSSFRKQLIDFDYLDSFYQNWIAETGRENTMDEYGMLLDYIGHARQNMNKKYLLIIVSNRQRQL